MISIEKIRDDKSSVTKELSKKDKSISLDNIVKSDSELRDLTKKLNDLQSKQNKESKEIGKLKSKKNGDKSVFEDLKSFWKCFLFSISKVLKIAILKQILF